MPALADRLADLLPVPQLDKSDLFSLLQVLSDQHFTGPITLHFKDGKPCVADLPTPKIRLTP